MGNLPTSIAETRAEIARLMELNPGDALVAEMHQVYSRKPRQAAETVAELKNGIVNLASSETVETGFQKMGDALTKT